MVVVFVLEALHRLGVVVQTIEVCLPELQACQRVMTRRDGREVTAGSDHGETDRVGGSRVFQLEEWWNDCEKTMWKSTTHQSVRLAVSLHQVEEPHPAFLKATALCQPLPGFVRRSKSMSRKSEVELAVESAMRQEGGPTIAAPLRGGQRSLALG